MNIAFYKYQGTGNDFIVIDNRNLLLDRNILDVPALCDRKFGIGADGLILIENHPDFDFEMVYFNADGTKSFCGNGSRCAVAFAKKLGIIEDSTRFLSTDGEHFCQLDQEVVKLQMHDVPFVEKGNQFFVINTGSPHYISFVEDVARVDILNEAKAIRYNQRFSTEGINVNFAEIDDDRLKVRTYERGVEDETLSCGTGVTAVALAHHLKSKQAEGSFMQAISTPGGNLSVQFHYSIEKGFTQIALIGPAKFVFTGQIPLAVIMPKAKEIEQ